jgi:hypothetical protein
MTVGRAELGHVSILWRVLLVLDGMAAFLVGKRISLDRIPPIYVDDERGGMRCNGNRCTALVGDVGISTACEIYALRPDVCKPLHRFSSALGAC